MGSSACVCVCMFECMFVCYCFCAADRFTVELVGLDNSIREETDLEAE